MTTLMWTLAVGRRDRRPWNHLSRRRNRERAEANGPGTEAIREPPSTHRSIKSTRTTSRGCGLHGGGRASTRASARRTPKLLLFGQLPGDAADDWRCALQPERHRARRGVSSRNGQDALGPGPVSRRRGARPSWRQLARRRLLGGRRRTASLRRPRRIPDRARSGNGQAVDGVRRGRPGQPAVRPWSARHAATRGPAPPRSVATSSSSASGSAARCRIGRRAGRACPAPCRRSTCARESRDGSSIRSRVRAKSAARPGRTIPGRSLATPTCGRSSARMKSRGSPTCR